MFRDSDLDINPDETIGIDMTFISGDNQQISFNEDQLIVEIDTRGAGIDVENGYVEWSTKLKATDKSGEFEEVDMLFWLQRVVKPVEARINIADNKRYDEGTTVSISELITIDTISFPDHNINLIIEHAKQKDQVLTLIYDEVFERKPSGENNEIRQWKISGNIDEVKEQLGRLKIETTKEASIRDYYNLKFTVYSQLGVKGLKSEEQSLFTSFKYDAMPTIPEWEVYVTEMPNNIYKLEKLSDHLKATIDDDDEELTYSIKVPSRDIVLADHSGHSLGFRNGSEWILNEAEWENAIIRSENSNAEVIDLEIQAISRQIENGRVAAAKVENFDGWLHL